MQQGANGAIYHDDLLNDFIAQVFPENTSISVTEPKLYVYSNTTEFILSTYDLVRSAPPPKPTGTSAPFSSSGATTSGDVIDSSNASITTSDDPAQVTLVNASFNTGSTSTTTTTSSTLPLLLLPVCIAYNFVGDVTGVSASTLAEVVKGNKSTTIFDFPASEVKVFLPPSTSELYQAFMRYLQFSMGTTIRNPYFYVVNNPADNVTTTLNSIGVITNIEAQKQNLPCLSLLRSGAMGAVYVVSPMLDSELDWCYQFLDWGIRVSRYCPQAYPLVHPVYVRFGPASCERPDVMESLIETLLSNSLTAVTEFGGVHLAEDVIQVVVVNVHKAICSQHPKVIAKAHEAVQGQMRYAIQEFDIANLPPLSDKFDPEAFADVQMAGSDDDIVKDPSIAAQYGMMALQLLSSTSPQSVPQFRTTLRIPFGVLPVSVIYNMGTENSIDLTLTECLVYRILSGNITRWNDFAIRENNAFLSLVNAPIVLVLSLSNLLKEILSNRLAYVAPMCGLSTSDLKVRATFTNQSSFTEVGTTVESTANSLGLSFSHLTNARVARIITAYGNKVTAASVASILPKLIVEAVHFEDESEEARLNITKIQTRIDVPFVSVLYAEFPLNFIGHCGKISYLTDMFVYMTNAEVKASFSNANMYLRTDWGVVAAKAKTVLCNGTLLYTTVEYIDWTAILTPANIAIFAAILVSVFMGAMCLCKCLCPNFSHMFAPKCNGDPYTIMFTDIESSTKLWNKYPKEMKKAVEMHHSTIRWVLWWHRGYEVKTIGDSFMCAFKSPERAVDCAVAIQQALLDTKWGTTAFDELYEEKERKYDMALALALAKGLGAENATENAGEHGAPVKYLGDRQSLAPSLVSSAGRPLWNGIRVRIGLHFGEGNITMDRVLKRYDYYGTVVNAAARVESLAGGGQILITAPLWNEIMSRATKGKDYVVQRMGMHELRGIEDPMEILQVSSWRLAARHFRDGPINGMKDLESSLQTEDTYASVGGGLELPANIVLVPPPGSSGDEDPKLLGKCTGDHDNECEGEVEEEDIHSVPLNKAPQTPKGISENVNDLQVENAENAT